MPKPRWGWLKGEAGCLKGFRRAALTTCHSGIPVTPPNTLKDAPVSAVQITGHGEGKRGEAGVLRTGVHYL